MKIKNILIISFLTIFIFSCNDENFTPFDFAGQSIIDDEALVEYMKTHYYNSEVDSIKKVANGEIPFYDSAIKQVVVENDVTYNLYYIVSEQGVGYQPTKIDDVLTTYRGELLTGYVFDERESIQIGNPWFNLTGVIKGWSYGFTHFQCGENVSLPGMPLEFIDIGKGFLFIPSGLGYGPTGTSGIPASAPLVFTVGLHFATPADHDNDTVISNDEDIDGDGDVSNDDTDGDFLANYIDPDDDGDGILTKNEDANGNGDPTDDDTDGDGIPDYLDKDN